MTTTEIKNAAANLFASIQADAHTMQQQDILRQETGKYAEDLTQEEIEAVLINAVENGFFDIQDKLTA